MNGCKRSTRGALGELVKAARGARGAHEELVQKRAGMNADLGIHVLDHSMLPSQCKPNRSATGLARLSALSRVSNVLGTSDLEYNTLSRATRLRLSAMLPCTGTALSRFYEGR